MLSNCVHHETFLVSARKRRHRLFLFRKPYLSQENIDTVSLFCATHNIYPCDTASKLLPTS